MSKDSSPDTDPIIQDLLNPTFSDVESATEHTGVPKSDVEELVLGVGATALNTDAENAGKAFVDDSAKLFEKEHVLRTPPKPVEYPYPTTTTTTTTTDHILTTTTSYPEFDSTIREYKPPSVGEQIANLEKGKGFELALERLPFERQRENFGQTFKMVAKFDLNAEDDLSRISRMNDDSNREKDIDPVLEIGLANRLSLYRYLQQRGLVLIDDSGLSSYAYDASQKDHDSGSLFLPESIDKETLFAFEDEVRSQFPFSKREMTLASLRVERDEHRKPEPEEFQVEDDAMRELVDFLASDQRFVPMFEQAESLQAARRENRRAQIDIDQQG